MTTKKKHAELDDEEQFATSAPDTPVAPVASTSPVGMVRCRVHTGSYIADKTYEAGAEVLVPADEVAKLAHCLAPVK
jgi:hypothetical protein